jgi:hypothetical protein
MKHINNFESFLILEDILSLIPLNESNEREVSKSTFSNVLDKVKQYTKKGVMTAALISSLLGSAKFTQAQENQLKQVSKTEQQVVKNTNHGLVTCVAGKEGGSKSVEFITIKWELSIEKNYEDSSVDPRSENIYVVKISCNKTLFFKGVKIGSEPVTVGSAPLNKEGKEILRKKSIEAAKEAVEKHVGSKLKWIGDDAGNSSAVYYY